MVLYALVSNQSIGALFLGGIVPGLLMGGVLMVMNAWIAHRRGFELEEPVPLKELPGKTARAFPALLMPVILLYGIYGGVTTPTEAAAVAAFGAEVEHPVGGLHDVEIVLDDDDSIAGIDEFMEHFEQFLHILKVQACGRLIEDIEGAAGGAFGEFLGKLDALGFAAGQRCRLLADFDIAEADLVQRVEFAGDGGHAEAAALVDAVGQQPGRVAVGVGLVEGPVEIHTAIHRREVVRIDIGTVE